ncbi:hypothetical protein PM082_010114 [Marasmius tenuissimus]|nr:hypothetical protein PM082_010114 [Marasmius tenuissimus]
MAISSDAIIIIVVVTSVVVLILAISSRFILGKLGARKSAPLPPKQPLAHHRTSYYQAPQTPLGYYHSYSGGSQVSLGSKERLEEVQSIPSSLAQTPLQVSHLETPMPSFHTQATSSDSSLSAHSSLEEVPFPHSDPTTIPTSSTQATARPSMSGRTPRSRPLSHVSVASSHHTTRSRTFSGHSYAHHRRSGVPHDPTTGGVQIILPAPLAPTYTGGTGGSTPPPVPTLPSRTHRGGTAHEKRLSFADAWAPKADRESSFGSASSNKKLHRPRSSLRISYSPASSAPPSPTMPVPELPGTGTGTPQSHLGSATGSRSSLSSSQRRPATAPHRYYTPSPHSSRTSTPLPSPGPPHIPVDADMDLDLERGQHVVSGSELLERPAIPHHIPYPSEDELHNGDQQPVSISVDVPVNSSVVVVS